MKITIFLVQGKNEYIYHWLGLCHGYQWTPVCSESDKKVKNIKYILTKAKQRKQKPYFFNQVTISKLRHGGVYNARSLYFKGLQSSLCLTSTQRGHPLPSLHHPPPRLGSGGSFLCLRPIHHLCGSVITSFQLSPSVLPKFWALPLGALWESLQTFINGSKLLQVTHH